MPKLTLLTKNGTIHQTAGLNWGQNKKNHTRPFDAYIPIHIKTIRDNPLLFSPKKTVHIIKIVWDDGVIMRALLEGNLPDKHTNQIFPKQISSTPHKDVLGKYLRGRMGINTSRIITLQDLINYGRTDVLIQRVDNTNYKMDFSISK